MGKGSIVVKLFGKLCALFSAIFLAFKNSFIYRLVCSLADGTAGSYKKSACHGVLTSPDVERHSEGSKFYRVFSAFTGKVTSLSDKLFGFFERAAKNSGAAKLMSFFAQAFRTSFIGKRLCKAYCAYTAFFGFVIAVMFCVPHSFWNNLFGLAIALVSLMIVLYGVYKKKDNVKISPDKTYLSLILFFACLVISTVLSQDRGDSIRVLMFFVTSFILCISVSVFTANKESLRSFCGMLFAAVAVTGVIGIVQAIIGVEADASLTDLTLNADMPGRIFSTMGNANNFAQMLVLFMPYCAAFALTAKSAKKKLVLLAMLALPFAALLATYSRSGWIAFAVAVAVFVALSNRRVVPALIIICIVAIPFLPQSVLNRILTIGNLSDSSSSYRLVIWQGALEMLSNWWRIGLGIGPGAFKSVYPAYARGNTQDIAHCHMQFMEVFLETGLLGFICFVCLTFSLIKRAFVSTSSKDKDIKYFGAAAAASMTSIVFIGFFEYYWFYPRVMCSFFISAGLAISVYRLYGENKKKEQSAE